MNTSFIYESNQPAKFVAADSGKAGAILGKLQAPFFDLKNPTRNGRFYGEAVQDALNSDEFKEKLETRTLFGRLGHPMTEDEANEDPAVRAAVILTEFHKSPSGDYIEGTLEILNNDYGKQLKSLIDAGAVMGVSTRGNGDSYESGGKEIIRDYEFEALDVVTLPAVKEARVKVIESVDKSKRKKLESLIESSNDKYVLESLKVTVESSEMPNKQLLLEAINKKLSGGSETIESLANDIAELSSRLSESEKIRMEMAAQLKELQESQVSTGTTERAVENVSESKEKMLDLLRSSSNVLESMKSELIKKSKELEFWKDKAQKSESLVSKLREEYDNSTKLVEGLMIANGKLTEDCASLTSQLEEAKSSKKESDKITESLSKSKVEVNSLQESLNEKSKRIAQLESSNKKILSEMSALKSRYIESVAIATGISLEALKSKVNLNSTTTQIETAAKSIREADDARRVLPDLTKLGKTVTESQVAPQLDSELSRAVRVATLTKQN